MKQQITQHIMMVRPANFGFNEETATNNAFQNPETNLTTEEIREKAIQEFDGFVRKLSDNGIRIHLIQDTDTPRKPDAVFPNNWVTFHHNGTVITYPLNAVKRRVERREDIIDSIKEKFDIKRRVRFEEYEGAGKYLEGTGSMILDRIHRIAYACIGPRTDEYLFEEFCKWADYKKAQFRSIDDAGQDIYHTNVMMALGESFVVICLDTIHDAKERSVLENMFKETEKEIIEISLEQMKSFAGNMLQVRNEEGKTFLVMSEQAFKSLSDEQVGQIEKHTNILHAPLYTIEQFGGGSARCMMAEIFLPEKESEVSHTVV